MSNKATINARIDSATKAQALDILHSLGLNTTQAISLFFKQIIYTNGIPFELKLPNETTAETFRKTDSAQDLHRVSSVTELQRKEVNMSNKRKKYSAQEKVSFPRETAPKYRACPAGC